MANLIPQIAQMLGVEIGEEFKVKGYELTYMITDDKGLMATNDSPETGWTPANALFVALLNGKSKIVKLPWKLKVGWVYRTRAEAEAALPAVAKEVGVEYELPTSDTKAVEPWKPKEGEFYYSFGIFAQTWGVSKICWLQHPFDFALLAKGWVYRTKEEAEAALPKVAAEFGVEYEP